MKEKLRACRLPRPVRDLLITLAISGAAAAICWRLARVFDDNNPFAASVFILAVVLTARLTEGYLWGILAAAVGVFCVNYMFTYPFYEFNLSVAGYPLTFSVMLVVSVTVSTLTSQVKRQQLLRAEAQRERLRANLLRSVAHDLRTPMTSILGASSALLEEKSLPPEQREQLLRGLNGDARWLMRVMENILSITKLSADDVALKKETEVVEEIVGSAIVKFRRTPGALPVTVEKPDEILLAPMEATLIEQVLLNLFENTVAHGERATRIRVWFGREAGGVTFRVEDDGAGIPQERLTTVFDGSASSAASDHSDSRRNMGIGLSVCRSIVLAHGGIICAYIPKAGGAGIRFWLPMDEEE